MAVSAFFFIRKALQDGREASIPEMIFYMERRYHAIGGSGIGQKVSRGHKRGVLGKIRMMLM